MSIGSNIKRLRTDAQLSQAELGKIAGVTDKAVSTWEADIKTPRMGAVEKMAAYFGVPKSAILDDVYQAPVPVPPGLEPLPEMATVPLIGDIACGTPITAEQNVVDRIGVPAAWRADYALTCHGDSMVPKIQDGDIVCVRCQPMVENGEIAVVLIDGEATLKRFYRQGDTVTLMPENQAACAPMVYQGPEINELCIEGKAVGICRAV